jgi:nitrate reductase NapA
MKTNRRQFFRQVFAAGASGAVLAGCGRKDTPQSLTAAEVRQKLLAGATVTKGVCRFCGTGCGVLIYARDGKVVATEGDPKTPVNKGLNCIKGYHLSHIMYGKDRLTKPLIRKNGKLTEASWSEALDLVAGKIKETLAEMGPDGVAIAGSGQWTIFEGYVAAKYWKAGLKSNHIDPNARFCMASAVMGFMTTFGSDEPMGNYEDLDLADVFVTWGANMAEQHPILFSRLLARKTSTPGVELWDFGTRFTRTSEEATEYLEFEPGSDLALANALAHVIVKEKLYNEAFIRQHVIFKQGPTDIGYGLDKVSAPHLSDKEWDGPPAVDPTTALPATWDDYVKFLEDYSPEAVEKISGVPAEKIRQLARRYGDPRRRVMSLWTMGVNQHYRGTWMNNLIYNLHLLTGKIATPGNSPFSLTGQPSACGTAREVGTFAHRLPADMLVTDPEHRAIAAKIWLGDEKKGDEIPAKVGYHLTAMLRAFERGRLRFLWISCNNPYAAAPNLNRMRAWRKNNPKGFLVVSDVYPNASTELADVVFPSAMWAEKEGAYGNAERRTQFWKAAVPPAGEAKPDVWQFLEVARRTGHGHLFPYKDETLYREIWEEYRQFGAGRTKDMAPYEWYHATHGGGRWPMFKDDATGDWKETPYRYNAAYDPYAAKILGKKEGICFYKKKWPKPGAAKDSHDPKDFEYRAVVWLRPYQPPPEIPDKEFRAKPAKDTPPDKYPYWLCTGRVLEHWHTGTMTRRVSALHRAMPEAFCEMHPEEAAAMGLKQGQMVKLKSRRGELLVKLDLRGRARPAKGSVFVQFFDEARAVNLLTLDHYCPISKEPDYKKCAVRVEPA